MTGGCRAVIPVGRCGPLVIGQWVAHERQRRRLLGVAGQLHLGYDAAHPGRTGSLGCARGHRLRTRTRRPHTDIPLSSRRECRDGRSVSAGTGAGSFTATRRDAGGPGEQPALQVLGRDRAGVVVGLGALLLGPVVPGVASVAGEADQVVVFRVAGSPWTWILLSLAR